MGSCERSRWTQDTTRDGGDRAPASDATGSAIADAAAGGAESTWMDDELGSLCGLIGSAPVLEEGGNVGAGEDETDGDRTSR